MGTVAPSRATFPPFSKDRLTVKDTDVDINSLLQAKLSERLAALQKTHDCGKCQACLFRDCELASAYRLRDLFHGADQRRHEQEAWERDLKRATMPEDSGPTLNDFDHPRAAWGNA
ncbi:hypothetical protein MHY1_01293 [Methylovirgula sp. HY1]|nr:hypothetical protein MHY1_01293 [Methylovirgula sp. HY1]